MTTLQDLCEGVSNEQLNMVCSDSHLEEVANEINLWQELHPFFFTGHSVTNNSDLEAADALQIWKITEGHNATYQHLMQSLLNAGKPHLAEIVYRFLLSMKAEVISTEKSVESFEALSSVCTYLKECYIQEPAPCVTDWPVKVSSSM